MKKPKLSYAVWFTQRTGSTLLCKALQSTGIAGIPNEWLNNPGEKNLVDFYGLKDAAELQQFLWRNGSTPNGVFGVKFGLYEPHFSHILETFRQFPGSPQDLSQRAAIWDNAIPNCRHIFMTRRNKVRLAVSWWKAIKSQEWHREFGASAVTPDLEDAYLFAAIDHLYNECCMREAGIQAFFTEGGIIPLTIVYEDFIQTYEKSIRQILKFLDLDPKGVPILPPHYEKLADDISQEWVQRFREEKQKDWQNRGW